MNCSHCGSPDVRPSKRARSRDLLERMRGNGAFRCRACRKRFYAPETSAAGLKQAIRAMSNPRSQSRVSVRARRRLVHKLVVISIFAVAFVFFWFFLRFITAEANPNSSPSGIGNVLSDSDS